MSISTLLGRPRDASRDVVIEKAAIELLREVGYERLSIEAVALRAQVSKSTIYRRWKNKAELIADAVHHYAFCKMPSIDSGTLRGDLIEIITEKVKTMKSADGQLFAGLMAASRTDNDLSDLLTKSMADGAGSVHSAVFERAIERGEISANASLETVLEIAPAVITYRLFMSHQNVNRKFIEHLVDDVLLPVLSHSTTSPLIQSK
ncbi:MAG: TetR/AcrR family transcriptional regulator [Actinobacteria bacterium]|nr:TetR/AcrR family transcriptional regulator [Actinomycetota bacterium]